MGIERREVSHFKLTGTEDLPRDLKGEIIHKGKGSRGRHGKCKGPEAK